MTKAEGKAIEAPNQIWIDNLDEGFWFNTPSGNKSIEYSHTDAFIEKACVWIKENLLKHTYVYEGEVGIGMTVFLEEFKQAMKGE